MVDRTTLAAVSDGDQLSQGYFNAVVNESFTLSCNALLNLKIDGTLDIEDANNIVLPCNTETSWNDTSSIGIFDAANATFIAGGNIYDNIDDSSINAVLWTTVTTGSGNVFEDTDKITIESDATSTQPGALRSNGSSGLFVDSGSLFVLMDMAFPAVTTNSGDKATIRVKGDGGTVDVFVDNVNTNQARKGWLLKIDADTDLANVWEHTDANTWTNVASDIDVSGAGANMYFEIEADTTVSARVCRILLYKVCQYTTDADSILLSDAQTIVTGKTLGFHYYRHYKNGSTDPTSRLSYNNGSNFTTTTQNEFVDGITTGTQLISEITIKTNNNETPDELGGVVVITK